MTTKRVNHVGFGAVCYRQLQLIQRYRGLEIDSSLPFCSEGDGNTLQEEQLDGKAIENHTSAKETWEETLWGILLLIKALLD
jgi:hypothetical protein